MPNSVPDTPRAAARSERPAALWPLLLVGAATIAAYANTLNAPFIYDDLASIVYNPQIKSFWPPWEAMSAADDLPISGRPLVSLTLALNYAVSGMEPWSYHAFNVAVHFVCAMLFFGLVRRTLRLPQFEAGAGPHADRLAAVVALLFAVHPLQTDAVTYTTQRTELMMAMFYLLTLYGCLRAWTESGRGDRWVAVAIVACLLGMFCKEVMVSAPLAVLLYDRTFISGSFRAALRRHGVLHAGLWLTLVPLLVLVAGTPRGESTGFGLGVSAIDYLRTQACVIVHYLRLSFWPSPLVISYAWPIARTWQECTGHALLLAGLFTASGWALWRGSWLGFLGACFFLILAPSSSVVPVITEVAAERRMYLPLATIIIAVTMVVYYSGKQLTSSTGVGKARARWLAGSGVTALALALTFATYRRNEDYQSLERMWSDAVAKRPLNADAHNDLAWALFLIEKHAESERYFRKAIELQPNHTHAHQQLAEVLTALQRLPEAIEEYRIAVRITPKDATVHNELGVLLARTGNNNEALGYLRRAVELSPDYAAAYNNLAIVLSSIGQAGEAATVLRKAIEVRPDLADAHANLGHLLGDTGNIEEAVAHFREALRLKPGDVQTRFALGEALERLGKDAEAGAEFTAVLQSDPSHAGAAAKLQPDRGTPQAP